MIPNEAERYAESAIASMNSIGSIMADTFKMMGGLLKALADMDKRIARNQYLLRHPRGPRHMTYRRDRNR